MRTAANPQGPRSRPIRNPPNRLRELRVSRQWRQEDVGRMVRVSRCYLSNWETGREPVDPVYAPRLASVFGVSVTDLLSPGVVECSSLYGRRHEVAARIRRAIDDAN